MQAVQKALQCAAALLSFLPVQAADCCKDSVAVVETVSGQVTQSRHAVFNLEWLSKGATLEVGAKSSATIILLSGRRFELGAGAKATVAADNLKDTKGPVRELTQLPPIPTAAPIADRNAVAAGAVRFRGPNDVRNLYPGDGMSAIADTVKLTFSSAPEASAYRVEIEDQDGNSVANWQTSATVVQVSAGTLKPGARYSWHVRAIGRSGIIGQGSASFTTLHEQDVQRRRNFSTAVRGSADDSNALALMADLDLRLGLLRQAQEGFQAALKLNPADLGIQRALHLVEAALLEKLE